MAPLLDVEKVSKVHGCNCSTFPVANDVLVKLESVEESQVDGKVSNFICLKNNIFLVGFHIPLVSKQTCLNLM